MDELEIATNCLKELKVSLKDEYNNSPVSPEDRYELKTIEEINGVLEELKRAKEQREEKTQQEKFEDWIVNCPAFEKDCTDSWGKNEDDGTITNVYCYWFKVEGEE